jgi:RHS repeat-associated protein
LTTNKDPLNTSTWTGEPDFYDETGLTYDLNGNIKTLNRNMDYYSGTNNPNESTTGSFNSAETIDQLNYTYPSSGGNQLIQVADGASSSFKQFGFVDGTNSGNDYTYDGNGNLTSDQNKNFSSISYYYNNRVNKISINDGYGSYVQYNYDAAGIKLNQTTYIYNTTANPPAYQTNSTDYVGDFVLLNGQVLTVHQPEGRITAPTYENLCSNPNAGSLSGFTATSGNVALTWVTQNSQTFVTATNNAGTSNEGIFPISTNKGTSYPVTAGQNYSFKVLGYQTSGSAASLYVKTNLGDLVWTDGTYSTLVPLPTGSANENWASVTFTIPAGATSIQLGVKWNGSASGNPFYIDRVALYKTDFEYNFFMTDQVGSTRVVLQTDPGSQTYTATMEPSNQPTEDAKTITNGVPGQFLNMNYTMIFSNPTANTTPGGSYVVKMNSTFKVGPAKSLQVYPGDVINASVNSSYLTGGSYNKTTLANVLTAVASNFGSSGAPGDPGSIFANVTNTSNPAIAGLSPSQGSSAPSAFLNYILFDKDYNPLAAQSVPVPSGGGGPMALPAITAPEIGYVFIYLSYDDDSGNDVYFDDLKITVSESPVIQVNNYYPFGMRAYTWLRGGETDNAYLYQGKELIAQTGWHDFGSRMYAADLGRWFATDPKNHFASPYLAMGNIPMMGADLDGEWFGLDDVIVAAVGFVVGTLSYGFTHNWDNWGKALESGLAGAAIAEVGYLTAGGGLEVTAQPLGAASSTGALSASAMTDGVGSMSAATQFAGLYGATTGANVAEHADAIRGMSQGRALEAIMGYEGVSAIQAGSQTDWAEGSMDKLLYGTKEVGWAAKGVTSDAIGGFLSGGLKSNVGGWKGFDTNEAIAQGVGAGASKVMGNVSDHLLKAADARQASLGQIIHSQGLTEGRRWLSLLTQNLGATAVKEIVSVPTGTFFVNLSRRLLSSSNKPDKYFSDTNWTNFGSSSLKDGFGLTDYWFGN